MAIQENERQQISLSDSFLSLSDREKKALEKSWAKIFAEEIFPAIDDGRFSVLYSGKTSAPTAPVNVIIGALIIKELLGYSDDELAEDLMLDLHLQYALHTIGLEEQPLAENTLSRFRKRCYDYETLHNVDLYHDCVRNLGDSIDKMMKLSSRIRRVNPSEIGENIRAMSRMELICTCISRMCAYLSNYCPDLLSNELKSYADPEDCGRILCRQRQDNMEERFRQILADSDVLLEICGADFEDVFEYEFLVRCLSEQTVIKNGKRQLRTIGEGRRTPSVSSDAFESGAVRHSEAEGSLENSGAFQQESVPLSSVTPISAPVREEQREEKKEQVQPDAVVELFTPVEENWYAKERKESDWPKAVVELSAPEEENQHAKEQKESDWPKAVVELSAPEEENQYAKEQKESDWPKAVVELSTPEEENQYVEEQKEPDWPKAVVELSAPEEENQYVEEQKEPDWPKAVVVPFAPIEKNQHMEEQKELTRPEAVVVPFVSIEKNQHVEEQKEPTRLEAVVVSPASVEANLHQEEQKETAVSAEEKKEAAVPAEEKKEAAVPAEEKRADFAAYATLDGDADIRAAFEFSKDGARLLKCGAGHSPKSSTFINSTKQLSVSFDREYCEGCPYRLQCKPTIDKNVATLVITPNVPNQAENQGDTQSNEPSGQPGVQNPAAITALEPAKTNYVGLQVRDKLEICIIAEGCYPYVVGGVSGWIHSLIRSFPNVNFCILAVVADRSVRGKFVYDLPDNVTAVYESYLDDFDWGKQSKGKKRTHLSKKEYQALRSIVLNQDVDWDTVFELFQGKKFSLDDLLMGADFLEIVKETYNLRYPQIVFSDFLWTMRSIFLPLFLILQTNLPKADIYHCVATGYAGVLGSMAKHFYRSALLVSEHGIYTREREEELLKADWVAGIYKNIWIDQFRKMSLLAYNRADMVTSLYNHAKELQIGLGCPEEKLIVTPNGIDVKRFENLSGKVLEDGTYVNIGAVLRVTPIKDVKTMIRSFAFAKEKLPSLKLWIMGPTDEDEDYARECFELVDTLQVPDVVFTGRVNVTEYLGRMDFTILTSISEGQPLTILESFAAHKPVIATDVGCCRELIFGEDGFGTAGILAHIMNTDELSAAMVEMGRSPQMCREMGENGYKRVINGFRIEQMTRTYEDIYEEIGWRYGKVWPVGETDPDYLAVAEERYSRGNAWSQSGRWAKEKR